MTDEDETGRAEYQRAIGEAVDNWQLVEMGLCGVFATVIRSPDARIAGEIFYAVQNFRDKLAMVDAAVKFTLWRNEAILPAWAKLNKDAERQSRRRNAIVHRHTWSEHIGDGVLSRKLGPPMTLSRVLGTEDSDQKAFIDVKQLREASASFLTIAQRARAFDDDVRGLLLRLR